MREALAARSNRDFAQAPRRARARAVEMEDEETLSDRIFAIVRAYPLEIAVAALLATAGGAITWNALALQTGRHPAPFFARGRAADPAPLPPVRPVPEFEALSLPPAPPPPISVPAAPPHAPAPVQQRSSAREAGEVVRTNEAPPLPVARPAATAPVARSAPLAITPQQPLPQPTRTTIGDLIRLGDAPPIPPALVGKVEPSRLVASGQRALIKLGYGPMKADGIMGPSTRQLIERFERDRRLPITGDFTPRTARELAAVSGLPVE